MTAYDTIIGWTRGKMGWMADMKAFATKTRDDIAALTAGGLTNALVYGAREISSGADVTLSAADSLVQSVTMTASGLAVVLPDATTTVEGQPWTVHNAGGEAFAVRDDQGGDVEATLAAGETLICRLLDGATAAGTWHGVKTGGGGGAVGGASETDMRLAFLMIAASAGDRLNMVDGVADPFSDESDIDTAGSSNETYDGAGDYYHALGGYTADVTGSGTPTASASLYSGTAAKQFDNDQSNSSTCGYTPVSGSWLKYDFGAGNEKTIIRYKIDTGHDGNTYAPKDWTLQGSNNDADWTTIDTQSNVTGWSASTLRQFDCPSNSTAYRYYRLYITGSNNGTYVQINEVEYIENQPPADITLLSTAFTADIAPDTGRIHVQVNPVDAITINTDLTAEISRDGGTTWSTATLVLVETLADGTEAYEDTAVDLSGQPSGTSIKYRIKTLNSKHVEIHGVVVQWT